ncbi:DMT family transporter [Bacillus glycinifermentans]|uniref:DMT family transporter n=1 Tax=Bacillus glycinifermentans TaxID=1664069 RepID=UPI001FF3D861|nr:DMT family transporter [Bacillus glycinifermentans]UOY88131.1 DMT family transporter [Bacillus glycinifermentans]
MQHQLKAYISMALAMAIVGSSVVVGKLMVETIPVFLSSGIRFLIAAAVLIVLLIVFEKGFPELTKKDVFVLVMQSFTGVFLFSVCMLYGVKLTTGMESGMITSTTPMAVGILAFFLLKERIEKRMGVGIVLAVMGVMTINLFGADGGGSPHALIGNLLIAAAVVGEAMFTLLAKLLSPHISALAIATFVSLFGFLFFLPFAVFEALSFNFAAPGLLDWSYVLYYALIVTVLAFYLWYSGVSKVSAGISGIFTSVLPVSAVVLSGIVLKEQFTMIHLIGITLVIAGIFVTVVVKKDSQNLAS